MGQNACRGLVFKIVTIFNFTFAFNTMHTVGCSKTLQDAIQWLKTSKCAWLSSRMYLKQQLF